MIRRLRGPAFLLMAGVIALLHQLGVIDHFWHFFWPLLLILLGVFMLAERAALAAEGGYPPVPYPCAPYPGAVGGAQNPAQPDVSTVPAGSEYCEKDSEGGQS
jgi:hypothetical protein